MRATFTLCLSLVIATSLLISTADAQGRRGDKNGNRGAAGDGAADPGNGQQNQHRERNGMGGPQAGGAPMAQVAQMLIAQCDQNGDGALNAAELQVALNALMQRMQAQMQQRQGMGQAMGFGMGMGMAQGQGQGQGMRGQFGAGQGQPGQAGQAGGRGGAGRGGNGGAGGGAGGGRGGRGGGR